jgi:hypothetical protein
MRIEEILSFAPLLPRALALTFLASYFQRKVAEVQKGALDRIGD